MTVNSYIHGRLAAWSMRTAFTVVLATSLAVTVLIVLWASDKGFDITDEGYYLLSYADPARVMLRFSYFDVIVAAVLGGFDPGVIGYRLARLVVLLLSASAFAAGCWHYLRACHPHLTEGRWRGYEFAAVLMLGNLLAFCFGPLTVSYNDLTNLFMYASAGLHLSALADAEALAERRSRIVLKSALIGVGLCLLFFVKWPSAIVLYLVLAAATFVLPRGAQVRASAVIVGTLTAAFALSMIVAFPLLAPEAGLRGFVADARFVAGVMHGPGRLISAYAEDLISLFEFLFEKPQFLVLMLITPYVLLRRQSLGQNPRFFLFLFLAFGVLAVVVLFDVFYGMRLLFVKAIVSRSYLLFLPILVIFLFLNEGTGGRRVIARVTAKISPFCLYLFMLPFIGSIGTGNQLITHLLVNMAAWFALMYILFSRIYLSDKRPIIVLAFAIAPMLAVPVQVVNWAVFQPQRVLGSLLEQSYPVGSLPRLAGLRLNQPAAAFLSELSRVMREETNYAPGDNIIAMKGLPGLVYALEGVAPGFPWLSGNSELECEAFRRAGALDRQRTYFLLRGPMKPELVACLRDRGLDHAGEFREVARIFSPYWVGDLTVFAPGRPG